MIAIRYRVLAQRWYDHNPGTDCGTRTLEYTETARHASWCVSGFELEIAYAVGMVPGQPGQVIGVTQMPGPMIPAIARQTVIDYLKTRAAPLIISVVPTDIELYVRTDS